MQGLAKSNELRDERAAEFRARTDVPYVTGDRVVLVMNISPGKTNPVSSVEPVIDHTSKYCRVLNHWFDRRTGGQVAKSDGVYRAIHSIGYSDRKESQ